MADSVVGLEIRANAEQASKTVGNIKKELKQAQQDAVAISQAFGELSPQAQQAAKRVAELRDNIADTNERIKLFDPGAKFQVFGNVLNTVAGGFSALTGAAALFGAESEDLQKTLVKVQGALALSQGLNVIADAGKDFQRLGVFAKEALAGIRTGIAATGIGALVVAMGLLVAYWEDIKGLVSGVSAEQERMNETVNANLTAEQEKLKTIDSQDNVLKLQGKSEKEILQIKIKQTDQVIEATKAVIEQNKITAAAQVKAAERNSKLLKGFLDFIFLPIKAVTDLGIQAINGLIGLVNKIPGVNIDFKVNGNPIEAGTSFLTKLIFDPEEVKSEGEKVVAESEAQLRALENQRAGFVLAQRGGGKSGGKSEKQEFDALYKGKKETLDEFREYEKEFAKQAEDEAKAKLQREKDDEERAKISFDLWKKREAEKARLEEAAKAQKVANAQIVSGALGGLADAVGRQTAVGKGLAVAQATIDGFLAVQKALASAPPPFNFIAAGVVGVATLANIRKIIATKIPGQGGGGGSAPAGLAVSAPSIPKPQMETTQLDQNSLNQIGNATARAFVVESDVSNSQERIRRLNRSARLN